MSGALTGNDKQSADEYVMTLISASAASVDKWKGKIHPTEMLLTHIAALMAYAGKLFAVLYAENKQTGLIIIESAIEGLEETREKMIKEGNKT